MRLWGVDVDVKEKDGDTQKKGGEIEKGNKYVIHYLETIIIRNFSSFVLNLNCEISVLIYVTIWTEDTVNSNCARLKC